MKTMRGGFVSALAAGALLVLPMSTPRVTRVVSRAVQPQPLDPKTVFSPQQKEFWLSADEFDYVRPGLKITVNSVTIDADLRPVVDVSYTDDFGVPLDRAGAITPGAISMSFVLAWWDPNSRNYTSYTTRQQTSPINGVTATQAAADSGGTWNDLDVGHSIYTFKTQLPAGYDQAATTTLGIYSTRDTSDVVGKDYYANVEYDFVPNGSPVAQTWDVLTNASCNGCHNPLSAHGGSRQDVKLCAMCHSPQTIDPDTGNTVDFKVMVHKIHMGASLPSVEAGTPYIIIGNNQSVNDFSHVVFPQDIRNCTTCHGSTDPGQPTYATQAFNWYTYPTRAACQSCHDDVNFATGENHPAGAFSSDGACATCHTPTSGGEWNAAVIDAHTVPEKSAQLKGVIAEIVSVTHTAPGQNPTVLFHLTQRDGTPIPPSAFTTVNSDGSTSSGLNVIMSGPTTDYAIPPQIRERADGATPSGNNSSYTFTAAMPADATGTWGFSIEARLTVTLNPAPNDTTTARDSAFNPVYYAAVTDSVAVPRRVVVDVAKCNTCHGQLSFHGANRLNPLECVFCHNPNMHDDQEPAESLDFKRLIHRIHRGTDLTQTYLGFNGVVFPGDLRDCNGCHTGDSQQIPENRPEGRLNTDTPRDWYTPQLPTATACLGCHDTQSAAAHAFTQTAPFGEACAACHGSGAAFSVDQVHAK